MSEDAPGNSTIGAMFGAGNAETFMGLPKASPYSLPKGTGAAILGVPSATPYPEVGAYCAAAPAAVRAALADYAANIEHPDFDHGEPMLGLTGFSAVDCGDIKTDPQEPATSRAAIRAATRAVRKAGTVPLVIGGDDSVPIPVLAAYAGEDPMTILQIDAHIDWRDSVRGESFGLSSTMRRASEMEHVTGIVQAGQRAIGSARTADWLEARRWGTKFVSARTIHREGVGAAIDALPEGGNIFISLDVDAFDPSIVPGVIGRAPGGLTYWHVIDLIEKAAAKGTIVGFAMVELMPRRDVDGLGALVAARTLCNVIAAVRRQAESAV
ncbi:arginase family protein [Tepidamorphus sp. 3E244]|uniref:arginase family protein n=1 Tax=Tepidamorphus sp. 3E244 TaxID=3385498 RepID=UPI0038FCBA3F